MLLTIPFHFFIYMTDVIEWCGDGCSARLIKRSWWRSRLSELEKHRVYSLECLINLFTHLGTSQYDFARHKDQQHDFRLDHTINKTRKQLWLILMAISIPPLQSTLQHPPSLPLPPTHPCPSTIQNHQHPPPIPKQWILTELKCPWE